MIRLKSLQDVLDRKDKIPSLAYIRGVQFLGSEGFDPERDGWLVTLESVGEITQIEEIGTNGLFTDDVPNFEFVETFVDGDSVVFEIVMALDDERTVAIFANQDFLDPHLFALLQKHSSPPQPLPTLDRRAL